MLKKPAGPNWEFEGFQVLTAKRLLLGGGTPVPLTSKAFDTLVVLIENRDRVVTKDELLRAVWPDVEVEEGNLTQQIFLLRKALGENAQQPRFIGTVPGHGYRFTGPVTALSADPATTGIATEAAASPARARSRDRRFIGAGLLGFGVVAFLAIVLGGGWLARENPGPPQDATKAPNKVTESGKATNSAMSPDGRYVAYVENDGDQYSVWVKQIGTDGKTQVVPPQPLVLAHLSFSPDGEYVYFARATPRARGSKFMLSRVPTLGGPETPILDDVDTPVSFSPDGRQFVFARGTEHGSHLVVAAAGGESWTILASREGSLGFALRAPDWSPHGKVVAATAIDRRNGTRWSIVLVPVDGGSSHELYTTESRIGRVRWLPDGSGLLAVVSEALTRQFPPWHGGGTHFSGGPIWRIGYPGGRAEPLTSDLVDHDLCCLDIGANGSTVTSVINSLVSDLWIAPADDLNALTQITWSNPVVTRHSWLPDDDTIVYRDLSGRLQTVNKDGRRARSLSLPGGHKVAGGVSACGDGRHIVFQAVPGKDIWRITPNAGDAVKLTSGFDDSNPACSQDGTWVMYSSTRPGLVSLWRVPIEGGEPAPLVEGESFDALPSPTTGRLIYYSASEWEERPVRTRLGRWIVISSSDRKRLFSLDIPDSATPGTFPVWAPDESGLDYVVTRNGVSNIWRQPLTVGPPVQITHFRSEKIFSFAWSRNGRWLSLARGANRSDVVVKTLPR